MDDERDRWTDTVAGDLGRLLRALHAVPVDAVADVVEEDAVPPREWLAEAQELYGSVRAEVPPSGRAAVERFTKEFAPLVTSGFAGTTGYTTGRPPVREVFAYWPALVAKSAIAPSVEVM